MFRTSIFHPQEHFYMLFYGISFMDSYKQSGRCQDVFDTWKKYQKIACTNLPEDEHLDFRNMSKKL
jgi:hypothetical protein